MRSRSVKAGVRVEFHNQKPTTPSTSTAGTPINAQRGRRATAAAAGALAELAATGVAPDETGAAGATVVAATGALPLATPRRASVSRRSRRRSATRSPAV